MASILSTTGYASADFDAWPALAQGVLVTALIVAAAGQDLVTAISTGLATVGNIGPGFGAIGPSHNYAHYPDAVKWWLSFAMLTGRLEVYSVLVLLSPNFWRR